MNDRAQLVSRPIAVASAGEQHDSAEAHAQTPDRTTSTRPPMPGLEIVTVVLAVETDHPVVLVRRANGVAMPGLLPTGKFVPMTHSGLDDAARDCVMAASNVEIGHVEQLAADWRKATGESTKPFPDGETAGQLNIGYLALTRAGGAPQPGTETWVSLYDYLPWEDLRLGRAPVLTDVILPHLTDWARTETERSEDDGLSRAERVRVSFGIEGGRWDDERVVERLDIIREAGVPLAASSAPALLPGHLRLVASALGRLRARVRSRPVIFELLAPEFTLFEMQRAVEGILGPSLHKQNFRRLVESTGLVEPTGEVRNHTGGRPAKLFRFRREVLLERSVPGVTIKRGCAA